MGPDDPDRRSSERDHPTRRRIMQATGAALASTSIVDPVAASDQCTSTEMCNAFIKFNDQTVGDDCTGENDGSPDSVIVKKASLPCSGFIDIHDKGTKSGPSGTFSKGYPLGASGSLTSGTVYTDFCIDLFEPNTNPNTADEFGECIDWNRDEWTEKGTMSAMLHLDTNHNGIFDHYCHHKEGVDKAYTCNGPVSSTATVFPDGTNT